MGGYAKIDLIVRGSLITLVLSLKHDRGSCARFPVAVADNLIAQLSDGAASMPAAGFAMGDVVLGDGLRRFQPRGKETAVGAGQQLDVYVVIAKEERRYKAKGFRSSVTIVIASIFRSSQPKSANSFKQQSRWARVSPSSLGMNGHRQK